MMSERSDCLVYHAGSSMKLIDYVFGDHVPEIRKTFQRLSSRKLTPRRLLPITTKQEFQTVSALIGFPLKDDAAVVESYKETGGVLYMMINPEQRQLLIPKLDGRAAVSPVLATLYKANSNSTNNWDPFNQQLVSDTELIQTVLQPLNIGRDQLAFWADQGYLLEKEPHKYGFLYPKLFDVMCDERFQGLTFAEISAIHYPGKVLNCGSDKYRRKNFSTNIPTISSRISCNTQLQVGEKENHLF